VRSAPIMAAVIGMAAVAVLTSTRCALITGVRTL
jgi:hypothetical protein